MEQFLAQINLVFQIIILAIISISFLLKKMKKLFLHGTTMVIATISSVISFAIIMLPSLLNFRDFLVGYPFSRLSIVIFTHAILGATVEILALWMVITWRLRSNLRYCSGKKIMMRVTFILWLAALFFGILTYLYLYDVLT
jgi:uncharacterized membrane protein YozB (DUF420 family)